MNKITIEKLVPGGQGLATLPDGKKAFFWNVIPGEVVSEFEITKKKSKYVEAIATKIEAPSAHRVAVKDGCFLATSPWQIMDFDFELKMKRELLLESFRQAGLDGFSEEIDDLSVKTDGRDFFYRNKMEYSLFYDHDDERIHLAFHKRGTHRKIPIETSSIERPEIFAVAEEMIESLNARGEDARKYQSLLLRCDQNGATSGGFFENRKPHPIFKNLTDEILGYRYSYSPNGFFQINVPVYEMALSEIKKHIETDKVLDLYAGVGTIGLSVAREKELTLVEVDKSAYGELVENCKMTERKDKISAVLAKSEEALEFVASDQTVIVDPPRAGLDPKLTQHLLKVLPEKIIYLSCNPATQARDLSMLTEEYKIEKVQPYNFFPRTPHLENLVILRK